MEDDGSLRWLYLDLNSFFASVQQQRHPHLRGKAIAVGPEKVDSGTIIAASYEAKAYGVRTGMRVAEARRRCPHLIFTGDGHGPYTEFHERIVAEVWRHIPVTQVCSIDEVACRLLDNERSLEQAVAMAGRIKAGIARRVGACLTSSIGIAPSRLTAKIAADMQKPNGLTILTRSMLPHALFSLPLSDVPGIGAKMEARLNARGITTMRDLLSQDRAQAGSAWGSVVGMRLWHGLHGEDITERAPQSRSIGHSHVLAPQARSTENVRLTARRLLMKAGSRLRRAESVTRQLSLSARFESGASWHAHSRMEWTDDSFLLVAALAGLWQRFLMQPATERVRVIAVTLDDIRPASGTQLSLFDPPPARSRALASAMDEINQRHGRNAVTLGPIATDRSGLIGTKIAFGRVPDMAEFSE